MVREGDLLVIQCTLQNGEIDDGCKEQTRNKCPSRASSMEQIISVFVASL